MQHQFRWTAKKIAQRLALIEPLVYRADAPLAPFHYRTLSGPLEAPPLDPSMDDSGWDVIQPNSYWGGWGLSFVMRTRFIVPADWPAPVALTLPISDRRDFRHPEALIYLDSQPYAAVDRFHGEIVLPARVCDGQTHDVMLHGWTGTPDNQRDSLTQLYMRDCRLVQV
ncbi:MAG TPA: hypothetical protein VER79_06845, partial [Candidatus Limnocylindrales bacterium]|nr:hypothetical protein [Candidatus Limnocylindrales bacterium]